MCRDHALRFHLSLLFFTLAPHLVAAKSEPAPEIVAPFGGMSVPRLLNPFSGHLPPSPPPPLTFRSRIESKINVRPRLKLTKRSSDLKSVITCTMTPDGHVETLYAATREPLLNGLVSLDTAEEQLSWSKLWLFPGLTDAATRLELRSAIDLRTGKASSEVKLGLRGVRKVGPNSLRIKQRLPLAGVEAPGRLRNIKLQVGVDAGATLTLPHELRLGAGEGTPSLGEFARAAKLEVDVDTLDLCVDL